MDGAVLLLYLLCLTGCIGHIIYLLQQKKLTVLLFLLVTTIHGIFLSISFLFGNFNKLLRTDLTDASYIYLILNICLFISLIYSLKYYLFKAFFMFLTLSLLDSNHFNVLLLIALANIELTYTYLKDKKRGKDLVQAFDDDSDFDSYEAYKIYVNLVYIAIYFYFTTSIFGSHFCLKNGSYHFVLGLRNYFNNRWSDIYLMQKIHGILFVSVFLAYVSDIIKAKLLNAD